MEKALNRPDWEQALRQAYERMENISIDYALMERADKVVMLEGDFGWNDVGSWEAVYQLEAKDAQQNCFKGTVYIVDSRAAWSIARIKSWPGGGAGSGRGAHRGCHSDLSPEVFLRRSRRSLNS